MSDLAAFYAARLDEDEAMATATRQPHGWQPEHLEGVWLLGALDQAHILRHDPARVLREVAAGRALLAEHQRLQDSYAAYPNAANGASIIAIQTAIKLRAAVWSDHPDYLQAWASGSRIEAVPEPPQRTIAELGKIAETAIRPCYMPSAHGSFLAPGNAACENKLHHRESDTRPVEEVGQLQMLAGWAE